jgi:hypothetical protein
MSFDRKIYKVCPHYVLEEPLYVSEDQVTVRPLRPIASVSSVKARINGVSEIPSYGIHVPAIATGSKIGPFSISSGVNDQLILQVGGGSVQTLTVPTGTRVTTGQLVASMNASVQGVYFSVTSSNRVKIESKSSGKSSILSLLSGSTLATTLGLPLNRVWRGSTPYPGWSLIQDPNTLSDRPTRLLVFDAPIKSFKSFVELDYATIREECRRCGGLGVENDWTYTVEGEVAEVRDFNLLLQEIQKICFTVRGSNVFHTWYGTNIIETIGKKLSSSGIVQNFIVSDIYESFRRWQDIKRQQEEVVGQTVSDGEYPFKLIGVNLEPDSQDPTIVYVTVNMQSRSSSKIIPITKSLKLPEPLNILGSSTQQSIFEQTLSGYTLTG